MLATHAIAVILTENRRGGDLRCDSNALPRTTIVAICVLLTLAEVGDMGILDLHRERSLTIVGVSTSPLASSLRKARITTGPDAK